MATAKKAQFPVKLYVKIDTDGPEPAFYAEADVRDLADVHEKTVLAVYRLDHVATLTVTTTLEPQ